MKEFASNSTWEEAFIQVQQEVLLYGTNSSQGCKQIIKGKSIVQDYSCSKDVCWAQTVLVAE